MLSLVLAFYAPIATAVTYDVSASGDSGMGLPEALELAQPGDSIYLADGIYDTALVSYRDGEVDNPITIEGSSDAIINGDYSSRSVLINHSFINLRVSQTLLRYFISNLFRFSFRVNFDNVDEEQVVMHTERKKRVECMANYSSSL